MKENIAAAYLHFPFCVKKCSYCDFTSYSGCLGLRDDYAASLCREIEITARGECLAAEGGGDVISSADPAGLSSVYMGGGTPSLFTPSQIGTILEKLRTSFGIRPEAEVTLEVNPGTVDSEAFKGYRHAGVNRISIGIQSFSPELLASIGRIHTAAQAEEAIQAARGAGFRNISCDLMTGLPGQTIEDVQDSLSVLLKYKIPHVSFYALTLEDGTPFFDRFGEHEELLPSQELEREMYHMMISRFRSAGYIHYEISNCALPGFESRHNMTYWKALPYYGFGCGASSYRNGVRMSNTPNLSDYIRSMESAEALLSDIVEERETISGEERHREYMMLGFRILEGVRPSEFRNRFGIGMEDLFGPSLLELQKKGLICSGQDRYFLSEKGLDFANEVFREFV